MRVGITGASGLLGSALTRALSAEHEVVPLVRSGDGARLCFLPAGGGTLSGLDVVVHLAGEGIFGRWTAAKKARILTSREVGTRRLAEALAGLDHEPRVLLSASGINYYGDRREEVVDEDSERGEGFLAEVCERWEAATEPASDAGIRVVRMRSAPVFTREGGVLAQMLRPFRLGVGGRIGSGEQWMSWIAVDDWVAAVRHLMVRNDVSGPVNLVSPNPVTNAELTRTLAKVLSRPALLPVPSFALKAVFGADAADEMLLASLRVDPKRLRDQSFRWQYPTLQPALHHLLTRGPDRGRTLVS